MYTRNCPECNQEINYQHKSSFNTANKKNSLCKKCTSNKTGFTKRYATKGQNCGTDNPFYGKKHTKESKEKMVQNRDYSVYRTKEYKAKISRLSKGSNNGMYGRSFYDVWIEKYGKEKADQKLEAFKNKQSRLNSGINNSMYGKPAPQGSGNGWKGWYNQFFFRSLRELTFILKMIEKGYNIQSAENISIEYHFQGLNRTYRPDFKIQNSIIEVKPIKLIYTPRNIAKTKAASLFCLQNNMTFWIFDCHIDLNIIKNNLSNIKFQGDYGERFSAYCNNHEGS